jgi:bifunctional UDP-N-acetylglucosamine pyrophosphorylase/glucosamine-1-phosphate N-acetyltransferase
MENCIAVVLAAGEGTRMKSNKLKVLHSAAGRPMIKWVLNSLAEAGVGRTAVVCGNGMEDLKNELGGGVTYVEQAQRLGTGHAVMQAAEFIRDFGGYVVIMPGDMPLYTAETIQNVYNKAAGGDYACVILTAVYDDPYGYGRIIRDGSGNVKSIVEEANATEEEKKIREANAFLYCIKAPLLLQCLQKMQPKLPKNEYYLTDVVELLNEAGQKVGAYIAEDTEECLGVNDRVQLAQVSKILYARTVKKHMLSGVTILDPACTYIDPETTIGQDTVIYPGVILEKCKIGSNVTLYQGSRIVDSQIGDASDVQNSVVLNAVIGSHTTVGPYAYLRPGTKIGDKCRVGDFVEVKNSVIGNGTKVSHLTYIGDGDLGRNINVGCGVVFVNYDGKRKYRSKVGDKAFIGCNTNLISPVEVGEGAYVAAGSTVTDNVPPHSLCIARSRQVIKTEWKDKRDDE